MSTIKDQIHIEHILDRHRADLGDSYVIYRNHVYRILNLIELLTPRRLSEQEVEKFAIAAVFHDLGLWTEYTLDYLAPSQLLASDYLASIHKEDWQEEIEAVIQWHHKLTEYNGPYGEAVNLFRKADWIDVTHGVRRFGVDRGEIVHLYAEFPSRGFHWYLFKRGSEYALRHPLRPLPIFKF